MFPLESERPLERFKDFMNEDILHRERVSNDDMELSSTAEIYNEALHLIENIFLTNVNKRLEQLRMPNPIRSIHVQDRDLSRETEFDVEELKRFVET